jgi:hypothetical protein
MKILIYSPIAIYSPHFETELEIALQEFDQGNEIFFLGCKKNLRTLCPELYRNKSACDYCQSRYQNGLRKISKTNLKRIEWPDFQKTNFSFNITTIEELKVFKYKNVDIGMGILSTLISVLREPKIEFEKYKNYFEESITESIHLIDSFEILLEENHFDKVYLFNGRMALFRPIMRVLQNKKIDFYVHERAGTSTKFSLTRKTYPHDLEEKKVEVLETFDNSSDIHKIQKAKQWYIDRRNKVDQNWPSFVKDQEKSMLPLEFNQEKRKISIFISSEDEFECIDGWQNPLFEDQNSAIEFIANHSSEDILFFVRIHPCLIGINNLQTQGLEKFRNYKNIVLINSDDKVDTYELMDKSEKIISFGSTMGIEASFWDKASISVGRSMYEHLGACYVPKGKQELLRLVEDPTLKSLDQTGALLYSDWVVEHGFKFKYFEAVGFFRGKFLGEEIKPSIIARARYRMRTFFNA